MKPRILVVEDEPNIARGLIFNLEEEGYAVTHAVSGEAALDCAFAEVFALVILDLTLPGMDGLEGCRHLRRRDSRLPILILTARADEHDRVNGPEGGADDYLTKPFSPRELILRARAIIRRADGAHGGGQGPVSYGGGELVIDFRRTNFVNKRGPNR